MACLITLKLEIKTLEKTFTRAHERFQIINASVDELTCRFIGRNGKKFDVHANLTVSFLSQFSLHQQLYFTSLLVNTMKFSADESRFNGLDLNFVRWSCCARPKKLIVSTQLNSMMKKLVSPILLSF